MELSLSILREFQYFPATFSLNAILIYYHKIPLHTKPTYYTHKLPFSHLMRITRDK